MKITQVLKIESQSLNLGPLRHTTNIVWWNVTHSTHLDTSLREARHGFESCRAQNQTRISSKGKEFDSSGKYNFKEVKICCIQYFLTNFTKEKYFFHGTLAKLCPVYMYAGVLRSEGAGEGEDQDDGQEARDTDQGWHERWGGGLSHYSDMHCKLFWACHLSSFVPSAHAPRVGFEPTRLIEAFRVAPICLASCLCVGVFCTLASQCLIAP